MGTKTFNNYEDLLTFTRASKGHALRPVSYGTELVTNGDFSNGLNGWTDNSQGSGTSEISVVNGQLNVTCVGSDTAWAYQIVTLKVGALYQISYDVIQTQGGNIHVYLGASAGGGDSYQKLASVGSHTDSFVADDATSYLNIREFTAGTSIIDNLSIKEITFDESDGTLTLFEHPNNIPRIEYDADGNLLGLLIEESRTNTIQYSEDFENSYWTKGGGFSIYGNNGIAPDGTRTATLLTDINDDDSYIIESNICSNGQTKSVWIRTVSGTATLNVLTHHDQLDGEVTVTEEWQRFERAVDISEPGGDDFFIFDTRSGTNTASDIYIWGAQLETGGFATSYIRSNSGSSTTRSSDVASIPTADFGFNADAGAVVIDYKYRALDDNQRLFELESGSGDFMGHYQNGGNTRWWGLVGSTSQFNLIADSSSLAETAYKYAAAYKENDFAVTQNAGTVVTDTSGTIPTVDTLRLGSDYAGSRHLNGYIKSIKYYPRRLTNAQLQEITS